MPEISNTHYKNRILSIDILRGLVILLMALDHVRDYFGILPYYPTDLDKTSVILFLTRWITNLCAPTFLLLSGMSAYLYGLKVSKMTLSSFLIKRGLFLILLEMTYVTFAWDFEFSYLFLQVIWVLGCSMMFLALLIHLKRYQILLFSLILIFSHNYFDSLKVVDPHTLKDILIGLLHVPFHLNLQGFIIEVSYPLVPWLAVMSLGYVLGPWMKDPVSLRNRKFFYFGLSALVLFVILRFLDIYGEPLHWQSQARGPIYTFLSFINVSKYPPSLFYILETLGIITILWSIWESWKGFGSQYVLCFGKVALFFYLIHLPLIHCLASLYSHYYFDVSPGWWWQDTGKPLHFPPGYHFNLGFVYLIWIGVIFILYPACLWYMKFKEKHQYPWLSYL